MIFTVWKFSSIHLIVQALESVSSMLSIAFCRCIREFYLCLTTYIKRKWSSRTNDKSNNKTSNTTALRTRIKKNTHKIERERVNRTRFIYQIINLFWEVVVKNSKPTHTHTHAHQIYNVYTYSCECLCVSLIRSSTIWSSSTFFELSVFIVYRLGRHGHFK